MVKVIDCLQVRDFKVGDKWSMSPAQDPTATQTGWSVSNNTPDRTINADGAIAEIGDGLTTLINDLIAKGILDA